MTAEPHAHALIRFDAVHRAGVDRIDWAMRELAAFALHDQILPVERIERRVMLEVEAVAEVEWLAAEDFELAGDVVAVNAADLVPADVERGARDEAVLRLSCGPFGDDGIAAAGRYGCRVLFVAFGKRPLILDVPVAVPAQLRLVARFKV